MPTGQPPPSGPTLLEERSRKRRRRPPLLLTVWIAVLLVFVGSLVLAALRHGAYRASEAVNQDPRTGPVLVFENSRIFKECDGGRLVYYGYQTAPAPVENAAECR